MYIVHYRDVIEICSDGSNQSLLLDIGNNGAEKILIDDKGELLDVNEEATHNGTKVFLRSNLDS